MDPKWNEDQPIYRQLRDRVVAMILEGVLGDGDWLFGARPSAADCAAVPFLSMMNAHPVDTPLRRALRSRGRLMDYVARGRSQLYPEVSSSLSVAA